MRKVKKFLSALLASVMVVSMSVPVFAAEPTVDNVGESTTATVEVPNEAMNNNEGIMPLTSGAKNCSGVGSGWYEIINQSEGRGGINANVWVQVLGEGYNGWTMQMDVKLYNKDNIEVWSGEDMSWISAGCKFWCGPDVTRVLLRLRPRSGGTDHDPHFTVSVNWVDGQ